MYGGASCQGRIKGNPCGIAVLPPTRLSRSWGEPPFSLERSIERKAHSSNVLKTNRTTPAANSPGACTIAHLGGRNHPCNRMLRHISPSIPSVLWFRCLNQNDCESSLFRPSNL